MNIPVFILIIVVSVIVVLAYLFNKTSKTYTKENSDPNDVDDSEPIDGPPTKPEKV